MYHVKKLVTEIREHPEIIEPKFPVNSQKGRRSRWIPTEITDSSKLRLVEDLVLCQNSALLK